MKNLNVEGRVVADLLLRVGGGGEDGEREVGADQRRRSLCFGSAVVGGAEPRPAD